MKYLTLVACLALSACATTYTGPKSADILRMCRNEGKTVAMMGDCVEERLTRYMPGWRDNRDAWQITTFTDYMRYLGREVDLGKMTDDAAYQKVMAYNDAKSNEAKRNIEAERQASQQRSAAAFAGSVILLNSPMAQPRQQPPAPLIPYPSDTTINIQQGAPYQFYDSRPYR